MENLKFVLSAIGLVFAVLLGFFLVFCECESLALLFLSKIIGLPILFFSVRTLYKWLIE